MLKCIALRVLDSAMTATSYSQAQYTAIKHQVRTQHHTAARHLDQRSVHRIILLRYITIFVYVSPHICPSSTIYTLVLTRSFVKSLGIAVIATLLSLMVSANLLLLLGDLLHVLLRARVRSGSVAVLNGVLCDILSARAREGRVVSLWSMDPWFLGSYSRDEEKTGSAADNGSRSEKGMYSNGK